jgi:hypothetical protein
MRRGLEEFVRVDDGGSRTCRLGLMEHGRESRVGCLCHGRGKGGAAGVLLRGLLLRESFKGQSESGNASTFGHRRESLEIRVGATDWRSRRRHRLRGHVHLGSLSLIEIEVDGVRKESVLALCGECWW